AVWGAQSVHQPEYLRVFVGQLRKKLESETGKRYIQTEPWVGYRFIPEGWTGSEEYQRLEQLTSRAVSPLMASPQRCPLLYLFLRNPFRRHNASP
ncbi:MAG: winged helix-turn-helix domain-containing protein, partial [Terracidiphilus sp.]